MGALSLSVPQSNDIQRHCFLRILFIPLFPKLTLVDHFFMPGFSSVVGSLPSGHVVMKHVTAWRAWKENLVFHPLHTFTLQLLIPPSPSCLPPSLQFTMGTHDSVGAISYSLSPSSLPTSYLSPSPQIFQTPAALS